MRIIMDGPLPCGTTAKDLVLMIISRIGEHGARRYGPTVSASFALGDWHRDMFLSGLDMLGASLRYKDQIEAFGSRWYGVHPWLRDVASLACARIAANRHGMVLVDSSRVWYTLL